MRLAIVYWSTSSVGGIATHLNTLRSAGIKAGDTVDILLSRDWKKKRPGLYPKREWVRGGDTNIWVDGEVPQTAEGKRFLETNYDAVAFGFLVPHPTKAYPEPAFRELYAADLPKVAFVMDGYFEEYAEWGEEVLPLLRAVLVPLESYALPLRERGVENVVISPFPFAPVYGPLPAKTDRPLVVWPCQWKNIKGITEFLGVVPRLPENVDVELYSNGIRYYQLRGTEVFRKAVGNDLFQNYHGEGRATFYGNVDLPRISRAFASAWFSVNLQGLKTRKETYRRGSYNNTEVEALYYGALPILHSSTKGTDLPPETYLPVDSAEEIPDAVEANLDFALDLDRVEAAREFVKRKHLASARYRDLTEAIDV